MPKQISNQLKNLKAGAKETKRPEIVMEAQKKVQRLNHLVKSFLAPENGVVLSKDVQASALQGLVEVNRLQSQFSQKCRSEHHLEMYREQFLQMKQQIQDLVLCIHLSLENGFFQMESRGFRLSESLKVSWQEVQAIYGSLVQSKEGKYLPDALKANGGLKKQVHGFYKLLFPMAAALLKIPKNEELSDFFNLEQLKLINRFFKQTQAFHRAIQKQHLDAAAKKKVLGQFPIENIDQLSKELHRVEQTIQRYDKEPSVLMDSVRFDEKTAHDLYARMNALHVQLESSRFLTERQHTIETLLAQAPSLEGMKEFSKTMEFEKKQVDLFIKHFSHINEILMAMSAILSNLAISFGKIFQLSLKGNLTSEFLTRAFQTTHNLLTKGIKLAEAQKSDSQQLKLTLQKATIFQKPVAGMIFSAFRELEEAKQEIINYDEKLMKKLAQASQEKELPRTTIQKILKEAYEERTELSNASIGLHNISLNFALLVKELKTMDTILQQIQGEFASEAEAKQALEKAVEILKKTDLCPPELMQQLWMDGQQLHWYVEEIVLDELRESRRFQKNFEAFMAPVKKRIAMRKIQAKSEAAKQIPTPKSLEKAPAEARTVQAKPETPLPVSPENTEKTKSAPPPETPLPVSPENTEKTKSAPPPETPSSDIVIPEKPSPDIAVSEKPAGEGAAEKPLGEFAGSEKSLEEIALFQEKVKKQPASIHDPFVPTTMKDLKIACHAIGKPAILSVLEVLERPHAFFDFLERLEGEYDPESPFTEALWLVEVEESQSAMDFVLGFAKVKFLPHGYFNANGAPLPYDNKNNCIEKPLNKEFYLKISSRYMETPKGIFQRLMRILLGYEAVDVLGPEENVKLINILEMDYLITFEERKKLHKMVPFVGG